MSDTQAQTPAKTRTKHNCGCLTGTGQTCPATTSKSFAQGHDARMASRLATAVAKDEMTADAAEKLVREAGGGDLLVSKMRHSAKLRAGKAEAGTKQPADRKPKGKDIKEALAAVNATPQIQGTKVRVGHGKRNFDAVVVKNASDKMVARHRFIGKDCDHDIEVTEGTDGPMVVAQAVA